MAFLSVVTCIAFSIVRISSGPGVTASRLSVLVRLAGEVVRSVGSQVGSRDRVHGWCPARLIRDQDAGHQDIIHVTSAEEELRAQHALDEEATRLIQAPSPDIAAQDPQRQLAGTPPGG